MDEQAIDWAGCEFVEWRPELRNGMVLVGTILPVEAIFRNFPERSPEMIGEMFGLELAQVRGVLLFAGEDPDVEYERIDWTGCEFVERVPGRLSGVPTLVDSRVTPETVVEHSVSGYSAGQIAWMFSLPRRKVHGVLKFVADKSKVAA